jgi:hypothetical protein
VPGRSASLTLKRLLVWVEEPIHKMRLMATLAGSVSDLHGGSLASAIDSHLRHGDANVSSFVFKIMQKSCTPLFQMIRNWLFSGVLDDPFSEFFVASDSSVPKDRFCTFTVEHFAIAGLSVLPRLILLCRARQVLAPHRNGPVLYQRRTCSQCTIQFVHLCQIVFHCVFESSDSGHWKISQFPENVLPRCRVDASR